MTGEKQEAPWPVPKFHFLVTIGDVGELVFQEVSGLETQVDPIEYRSGNANSFPRLNMARQLNTADVTLKKGSYKRDSKLMDYFHSILMNNLERKTVKIQLMDEADQPVYVWELSNAWPMQISGTDMNAELEALAIETLVLAYEGISMHKMG